MSNMPALVDHLYCADSVPDAITRYEKALVADGSLRAIQHALKMREFRDLYVTDREFLAHLRDDIFNRLYNLIDEKEPNVRFLIEGRRKSLIKTEDKICLYESNHKSLDLLRDMMAFRIILFGNESIELIQKSYEIMGLVINFCIKNGFIICDAEPIEKGVFNPDSSPSIIVPEKTLLHPDFVNCVKDYIVNPKENGYQSLHAVFRQADGRCFEIQIRTMDMHVHSEYGSACHQSHDSSKYGCKRISFDPSKVSMQGFNYSPETGHILDFIGLWKSAQVILRRKSF